MSSPAIDKYYTGVQKIKDWGGSLRVMVTRQTAGMPQSITMTDHTFVRERDLSL
jgi:hypothetical protein